MILLNINGPINAGKTTVSRLLAKKIPEALFVEVDDLLPEEEQKKLSLDFWGGINERRKRLLTLLREEKSARRHGIVMFAYPMDEGDYGIWKGFEDESTVFLNVTLAPSRELCLTNRGTRELKDFERRRILEMYEEGLQHPPGADLVIRNDAQTPEETATAVLAFLKRVVKI